MIWSTTGKLLMLEGLVYARCNDPEGAELLAASLTEREQLVRTVQMLKARLAIGEDRHR